MTTNSDIAKLGAVIAGVAAATLGVQRGVECILKARARKAARLSISGRFAQGIVSGRVSNRSVLAAAAALGAINEGSEYRVSKDGHRETWELVKNGVRYWIGRSGGVINLRVEVSENIGWDVGAVNSSREGEAHIQFTARGGTPPVWVHELATRVAQAMVA